MAVVIETTVGVFTVDLFVDSRPQACKNFLKLCKMKYYNFCLFHSVQPNFLAQTGDPTGLGSGGESIYGMLYGENVRYFEAEVMPKLKHNKPGLLSMVNCGNNMLGSQFFITLGEDLVSLDGTHCVFGEITEGAEVVLKLNEAICDSLHRPYKDIRITHTVILEDPFEDPSGLVAPDMSPEATQEKLANGRIAADEEVDETAGMTAAQVEEMKQEREANARATILEIVGDLPDAEMAPPENVLFVCKLNPVTTDDDLEIIFSRFGKVKSCEVIRDKTTGDSLQYAFVEFEDQKSCEDAYLKMDNVLIDDRRIHVDFSQSVAKMRWKGKGRGVIYYDNKDQSKDNKPSSHRDRENSKSRSRRDRDYDDKERRRDRGRDREEDRQGRDRGRDRDAEDRHRRRDERDRSRSDWRKRDSKHRKDDYRDEEKRYDNKRKDTDSFRKKDDDSRKVSSSTSSSRKLDDKRLEEKRSDDKRSDDRKKEKDSREPSNRISIGSAELEKNCSLEKQDVRNNEKIQIKEKEKGSKLNSPHPIVSREDHYSDNCMNDSREISNGCGDIEKSPEITGSNEAPLEDHSINQLVRRSSKEEKSQADELFSKEVETGDTGDEKYSQNSEKRMDTAKKFEDKKKTLRRKRKASESRKRKKRHHSSSSESSSESSSSDSSSSTDSSDHRHGKKKKLIVAKRYYRGGKLVKEIKKKKRTKDTTDSESVSEDSSDTDSKRKYKSKKHKKVINIPKHHKRKSVQSTDDSQSGSSSDDDSDFKNKKKKRKIIEKRLKKKHKNSTRKKKYSKVSSSSSDSENSIQNSVSSKSSKKLKKPSKSLKHNANLLETNTNK